MGNNCEVAWGANCPICGGTKSLFFLIEELVCSTIGSALS